MPTDCPDRVFFPTSVPRGVLYRTVVALYTVIALGACSPGGAGHADRGALDFRLPDTAGKEHRLSDYRGQWVIVNYWATWCKPCLEEIPQLVKLYDEYRNHGVTVLSIDYEDVELRKLIGFIHRHKMSYPVLRTNPTAAQKLGPIFGLPTTYVITPNGDLASTLIGKITRKQVEGVIATESAQRGLRTPQHG